MRFTALRVGVSFSTKGGGLAEMKDVARLALAVFLLGGFFVAAPRVGKSSNQTPCPIIEEAMRDYQQLKAAKTRREVEKYLAPDGGLQFPASTRYVYPRCAYLHVDVGFELVKPAEIAPFPEDRVIRISKIYLEYPAKD